MRTIVYIGTSLDGFIAREDGDIDWLTPFSSEEVNHSYEAFIKRVDAIIIGKGTFEKVLTFPIWPYNKQVFVLSSSMKQMPEHLKEKVTLLSMAPVDLLHYLSREGFSGIYVDGGKVIQGFLKEDLIDELIISKVPVLIGNGIPLFAYIDKDLQFEHIRTEAFTNGLVTSYYERKRTGA